MVQPNLNHLVDFCHEADQKMTLPKLKNRSQMNFTKIGGVSVTLEI